MKANRVKSMAARIGAGDAIELDLEVVYNGEDGPEEGFGSFEFGRTDAEALGHVLRTLQARGMEMTDLDRLRQDQHSIGRALEILTGDDGGQLYSLSMPELVSLARDFSHGMRALELKRAEGDAGADVIARWLAERRRS